MFRSCRAIHQLPPPQNHDITIQRRANAIHQTTVRLCEIVKLDFGGADKIQSWSTRWMTVVHWREERSGRNLGKSAAPITLCWGVASPTLNYILPKPFTKNKVQFGDKRFNVNKGNQASVVKIRIIRRGGGGVGVGGVGGGGGGVGGGGGDENQYGTNMKLLLSCCFLPTL